MATDLGQVINPSPIEGMRRFIAGMTELGFNQKEIDRMAKENPSFLLQLD
jgi:predicted metal-dependent phosphotriesterase family hydrolase